MEFTKEEKQIFNAIKPYLEKEARNRDIEEELASYGHRERRIDLLRNALSAFFEQPLEDVIAYEVVWRYLKASVKSEFESIVEQRDRFEQNYDWKLLPVVNQTLEYLEKRLDVLLIKESMELWRQFTFEQVKEELEQHQVGISGNVVVLVDKDGMVIGEPYPITADSTYNISAVVEDEFAGRAWKDHVVARSTLPLPGKHMKNVVARVLCEVPPNFAEARVIKITGESK